MRGRKLTLLIAGMLAVVLAVAGGWWYFGRSHGSNAQTIWSPDHSVGVQVAPGGANGNVKIEFRAPTIATPESPLSQLLDVVGPPVDIVPSGGKLTNADVVFNVDTKTLPTDNGRSINNMGIEVFNEQLGVWVPIPTTINGNQLVAHAPHFSIFRKVISKIGSFVVKVANKAYQVVLNTTIRPIELLAQVGFGVVKSFFLNITGHFDNSKYNCKPASANYAVTVTDETRQGQLAACVVAGNDGTNNLVIKNGLAVPFKFSADGVPGLSPTFGGGDDLVAMARNFANVLLGKITASGLDVGSVHMAANTPKQFTVNGSLSWVAAGVDIAMALVAVLVPEEKTVQVSAREVLVKVEQRLAITVGKDAMKVEYSTITSVLETVVTAEKVVPTVAGQAGMWLDAINCTIAASDTLQIKSWTDAAPKLVGVVQQCMSSALKRFHASEFSDAVGLLNTIAEQAKVIPEVGQLAAVGILNLFTGSNVAKVTFNVRQSNRTLDTLVGTWTDPNCDPASNLHETLVVNPDYTAVFTDLKNQKTTMHLIVENDYTGTPTATAVVDSGAHDRFKLGGHIRLWVQGGPVIIAGYDADVNANPGTDPIFAVVPKGTAC